MVRSVVATGRAMKGAEMFTCGRASHHSAGAGLGAALGPRPKRLALRRSIARYTTGVVYRVNSWLNNSPPTMQIPSGRRSSDHVPSPDTSGNAANSADIVVIRIGRKRRRHA